MTLWHPARRLRPVVEDVLTAEAGIDHESLDGREGDGGKGGNPIEYSRARSFSRVCRGFSLWCLWDGLFLCFHVSIHVHGRETRKGHWTTGCVGQRGRTWLVLMNAACDNVGIAAWAGALGGAMAVQKGIFTLLDEFVSFGGLFAACGFEGAVFRAGYLLGTPNDCRGWGVGELDEAVGSTALRPLRKGKVGGSCRGGTVRKGQRRLA